MAAQNPSAETTQHAAANLQVHETQIHLDKLPGPESLDLVGQSVKLSVLVLDLRVGSKHRFDTVQLSDSFCIFPSAIGSKVNGLVRAELQLHTTPTTSSF